jgi:ribosome production factor 1
MFKQLKKEERKKRNDTGAPKNVPKTIDSMREKDDTMVVDMDEEDQLELNLELERDELSSYFQKTYEPKVLITFSDNPHQVSFLLFCFVITTVTITIMIIIFF